MVHGEIDVQVEPDLVTVRYSIVDVSPHGRFYIGLAHLAFLIAMTLAVFFAPGKHDAPSMWQDISASPITSSGFFVPLSIILAVFGFLFWIFLRIVQAGYPGDQKLECNGETLTISRIQWFDWNNKDWITESYPLHEISRMRYGVLLSGKGNSIYGLRFNAAGRSYKLFPKLTTRKAGAILSGLEALGMVTDRRQRQRKAVAVRRRKAQSLEPIDGEKKSR